MWHRVAIICRPFIFWICPRRFVRQPTRNWPSNGLMNCWSDGMWIYEYFLVIWLKYYSLLLFGHIILWTGYHSPFFIQFMCTTGAALAISWNYRMICCILVRGLSASSRIIFAQNTRILFPFVRCATEQRSRLEFFFNSSILQ